MSDAPWEPVLYKRQPYADNHVDSSFLARLLLNASRERGSYASSVAHAARVVGRLAAVASVVRTAAALQAGELAPRTVAAALGAMMAAGMVAAVVLCRLESSAMWTVARASAAVGVAIGVLAPALQTLTSAYADDTVHVLAFVLFALSVLTHDYSAGESAAAGSALSLNAGVMAALLLASRVHSAAAVAAALAAAMVAGAALPAFERLIAPRLPRCYALFVAVHVIVLAALAETAFSALFGVAACLALALGGPAGLIVLRSRKAHIQGPWDEARRPVLSTAA